MKSGRRRRSGTYVRRRFVLPSTRRAPVSTEKRTSNGRREIKGLGRSRRPYCYCRAAGASRVACVPSAPRARSSKVVRARSDCDDDTVLPLSDRRSPIAFERTTLVCRANNNNNKKKCSLHVTPEILETANVFFVFLRFEIAFATAGVRN